jgi:hypothetical protein
MNSFQSPALPESQSAPGERSGVAWRDVALFTVLA